MQRGKRSCKAAQLMYLTPRAISRIRPRSRTQGFVWGGKVRLRNAGHGPAAGAPSIAAAPCARQRWQQAGPPIDLLRGSFKRWRAGCAPKPSVGCKGLAA